MRYKIKKGLIFEKKGNKITIFDTSNSTLIELNESASLILDKIKKSLNKKKILDILQKKYNITESLASRDLAKFTEELQKCKILAKTK